MIPPDVCPTEDAVGVFLDLLVDPLLPANFSKHETTSPHQQQKLAKQVHAVVILYNYYHRKQCPKLEFLYFSQFCSLAALLKQALLAYMDFVKKSDDAALTDPGNQLSLTEKTIMDTCDVCLRLDASKETPSIEGWPVSEVKILLVDSQRENCWLEFGSFAEGVWCMIEKNVDETSQTAESATKRKRITKRPTKKDSGVDGVTLDHLAFLAVKEVAGLDTEDLSVLESHLVYSLSREKSVSRFYLMQCNKLPNAKVTQMPIKDVLDRLQGPLITGSANGWCATSIVEYFPILPCTDILSAWHFRKISLDNPQNLRVKPVTVKFEQTELEVETKESTNGSHKTCIKEFDIRVPKNCNGSSNFVIKRSCDLSVVQDMDVDGVAQTTKDIQVPSAIQVIPIKEKKINHMSRGPLWHGNVNRQEETVQLNSEMNAGVEFHPIPVDINRIPNEDSALVHQGHSGAFDKVRAVLASRENDLSQTALNFLLKKRATLSLQLRKIEDEIALCDKDVRIIQNGGEDALAVKLKYVIDASCNSQSASCNNSQLSLREPDQCQELDDICNGRMLPSYRVSPCDDGFIATVTVKCTEREISATGEFQHDPRSARESAANKMLSHLVIY